MLCWAASEELCACAGAGEAGSPSAPPTADAQQVDHTQPARSHLRSVQLSTSCSVPVPAPAVEVARGFAELGTDGHACACIENVHALRPFLKVCMASWMRTA